MMPFSPGMLQLGTDVAKHIVGAFALWLGAQAVVIGGFGLVLALGSFLLKRKAKATFAATA